MNQVFTPVSIRNVSLKNRIVFAPTSVGRGEAAICKEIAAGGCGLYIMADLSVVPSMMGAPSLDSDRYEAYFKQIIDLCHSHGCKISAQLFHPEYDVAAISLLYRKAREEGSMSPEDVRRALAESTRTYCDQLTADQVRDIIRAFAEAAERAKSFGFDMVQIHGDRLIGSFTSPLFNHRQDEFGAHSVVPEQIVKAVRETVGDFPVDYKLTVRIEEEGLGRGGISQEEVGEFVRKLDACGVDSYHVALANHTDVKDTIPARNHEKLKEEGCFAALALEVKKYTDRPVCTVGKLQHLDKMEALLEQGIEMIGMSRQLVADPAWPKKAEAGDLDSIRYCLYCNQKCLGALKSGASIGCVLRPEAQEKEKR
ncbi:MAG: NADH:flavin oxidoreductase [Eubacteriales bacterium]|nr:NADH:flavin oxidoreductase [Eubacteriales bacterium]